MFEFSESIHRLFILLVITISVWGFGFFLLITYFTKSLPREWPQLFILAIATGISSITLIPAGLDILKIPLTTINLSYFFCILFVISVPILIHKIIRGKIKRNIFWGWKSANTIIFTILALSMIITRDLQIKEIIVPNWADGLIHTSHLQRFYEQQAIPFDRIYHSGFYNITLIAYIFSGLQLPEITLLVGQWISAMCGVSFYILAHKYIKDYFYTYICVLLYSMLLFFPSYLVSWGRYPYLLGLTLLPASILVTLEWLEGNRSIYFLSILLSISVALSHYGSVLLLLSFIFTYLMYRIIITNKNKSVIISFTSDLTNVSLLFLPVFILALPKIFNLLSRKNLFENMFAEASDLNSSYNTITTFNLLANHDIYFLFIFLGLLAYILPDRGLKIRLNSTIANELTWVLILWPVATWAFIYLQLALFGFAISTYSNFLIFLSMIFAISFGYLLQASKIMNEIEPNHYESGSNGSLLSGANIFLSVLLIFGIVQNSAVINAQTTLFTSEDQIAMDWIKTNTSLDAVFLIESFIWGNELVPSDAGGWINILTGRRITYPEEIGEYYDACEYIKNHHVGYIYSGSKMGNSNFTYDLSDINGSFNVIYETKSIKIISVACK